MADSGDVSAAGAARQREYADLLADLAPSLLRLAVMLTGTGHDGEDLLQSALTRAARHGDRIAAMTAPAAYLRRVVVNEHTSRGRRSARRVAELPTADLPEHSTASSDDRLAARDETWRWLATLTAQQRAVLALRYYEDLADAEIAAVLGCPESTVRSHARRGLAALRARLSSGTEEER